MVEVSQATGMPRNVVMGKARASIRKEHTARPMDGGCFTCVTTGTVTRT